MSRLALLSVLLSVPAFVACGGSTPSANTTGVSTVTGTIALSAYQGIDNPVVISRSTSGRIFVAPVLRTGAFRLDLPADESYRFVLASTRENLSYVGLSELHWAGDVVWGKFPKSGAALDLGTIRPVGSNVLAPTLPTGVATQDHGSDTSGGSSSGSGGGGTYSGGGSSSGGGGASGGSSGGGSSSSSGGDDSDTSSSSTCKMPGAANLPYDVQPQLGQTFRLTDAFLVEGPLPASVVSVTMDGGNWRLAELQANTPFTITNDDCTHQGNRDVGRDRVFITWTNAGGGQQTDHLDLRYCEPGGRIPVDSAVTTPTAPASSGECSSTDAPLCRSTSSAMPESECTGDHMDADYGSYSPASGATTSDYGSGSGSDDKGSCDNDIPVCPPDGATGGAGGATGGAGGAAGSAGGVPAGSTGGTTGINAGSAAGSTFPSPGSVPGGGGCITNADCAAGLACFGSTCVVPIR